MEYHANVLAQEGTEEALDFLDPKVFQDYKEVRGTLEMRVDLERGDLLV